MLADWAFLQPRPPKSHELVHGRTQLAKFLDQKAGIVDEEGPATATIGSVWRVALAVSAALLVALVPTNGAEAARSGGRMGGFGGGMRSTPPPQRSQQQQQQTGPRFSSGPNISIGVGPMIAPPMFGPPLLAPPLGLYGPPIVPVPSMGPSFSDQMIQDQQRRDERQIDSQKAQIEALQKEITELKAKKQ